jgi:hypothetical protein
VFCPFPLLREIVLGVHDIQRYVTKFQEFTMKGSIFYDIVLIFTSCGYNMGSQINFHLVQSSPAGMDQLLFSM